MKNIALSFKISLVFAVVSTLTLAFLYYIFSYLFDEHMLKVENEKASLIAQIIEPAIGMSHYLGMDDEVKRVAEQTATNPEIIGLNIILGGQKVWVKAYDESKRHIHILFPVKDPLTGNETGVIDLSYSLKNYEVAIANVKLKIFYYLGALAMLFVVFALLIRYLLNPLNEIARAIGKMSPGGSIDFSSVRAEKETSEIINAFTGMMNNVREHTVLLERYKHSMDESSIVSKVDLNGYITYVNDEFCRVSGFERDELVGKTVHVVNHPDFDQAICNAAWNTVSAGMIWKGSVKNISKNGLPYYVRSTIVPILDEGDEIIEYINIQNDITQLIEQKEQILRQTTDVVTGLHNRIKLEEDLKVINKPKLALISIDNYNIIRDFYGFDVGNRTLLEVANILKDFVQDKDVEIYKMASGEFSLVAGSGVELEFFELICKHMVHKIDAHTVDINDTCFNLHAYCGVTSNPERLLSYASLALQHAQNNGKPIIVYEDTENLVKQHEDNISWTAKIRNALKNDRIVVYVQPIYNASTSKIEKYECLVRLIDDDGKVVSPFFFLDIAKKSKLYGQITRCVVNTTIEMMAKIIDVDFTINLSVEDLVDEDTTNFIKHQIVKHGIGNRLVLEIVESEGFESFNEVKQFISDAKKLGCKIAIDDFGTGYSNFAYLLELNVDIIKIDGSLIKEIDHDRNSQIITSTILDFSQQLEITTVAEFVHNEAVLNYVKEIGIDYLQGFHLGEPVPIETLNQEVRLKSIVN